MGHITSAVVRVAVVPSFWDVRFAGRLVGLGLALTAAAGCSSSSKHAGHASGAGSGTSTASGGAGAMGSGAMAAGSGSTTIVPSTTPTIPVPGGGVPAMAAQSTLPLAQAAALGTINYVPNRSSVRLYVPGVAGVQDYRVFADEGGVSVQVDATNREHVSGATIHCAGLRQRNQCDDGEVLPIKYNTEQFDQAPCEISGNSHRPNVPRSLMQTIEVNGVGPNTTLIVEAIDRECPFPGLFGTAHKDNPIVAGDLPSPVQAVVNNKSYSLRRFPATFPLRTEAEIRAEYGSMIFNGQAPNMPTLDPNSPSFPESPTIRIGQPAPADDPVVLARAIVQVSPTGTATLPDGFGPQDYFDDFEDNTDQPVLLRADDYVRQVVGVGLSVNVYLTKKWVLYDVANAFSDFFVDRGQLNMVFGDPAQGSMTLQAMYPRRPVQLPTAADRYLYVTYEVQRNESPRRYENLTLCGSDQMGQTYAGDTPKAAPLPRPGFMNEDDTAPSSVLGWNCLLLIPRGAGYGIVPGGDIMSHSDSSLKVTIVRSHPAVPPGMLGVYDKTKVTPFASAYGPTQEAAFPKRWLRQMDASGKPSGIWLDDVMAAWQRARFDVFIRRDRVVFYVEGQQRICQDLDPTAMTMAEGALGFWHILYHTSAEFTEIRRGNVGDDPETDQHHVMHNTPFADQRSYDNVGFREDAPLPANFDPTLCYKAN
jgi:hypothetical protein